VAGSADAPERPLKECRASGDLSARASVSVSVCETRQYTSVSNTSQLTDPTAKSPTAWGKLQCTRAELTTARPRGLSSRGASLILCAEMIWRHSWHTYETIPLHIWDLSTCFTSPGPLTHCAHFPLWQSGLVQHAMHMLPFARDPFAFITCRPACTCKPAFQSDTNEQLELPTDERT
jgi:hypothetical protein